MHKMTLALLEKNKERKKNLSIKLEIDTKILEDMRISGIVSDERLTDMEYEVLKLTWRILLLHKAISHQEAKFSRRNSIRVVRVKSR
jgi:hypothetical protein